MQKQKAIKIIKEIAANCTLLNPKMVNLKETSREGRFAIHIEGHVDDESWESLKRLAKKHSLGVKLTNHTLMIYAPVSKKIGKLTLS